MVVRLCIPHLEGGFARISTPPFQPADTVKQLIYVEITSSELSDNKIHVMVSLTPHQDFIKALLAVCEGLRKYLTSHHDESDVSVSQLTGQCDSLEVCVCVCCYFVSTFNT